MQDPNSPLSKALDPSDASDVDPRFDDFRLTTAEIHYSLPGKPDLLQTYVWKNLDRLPDFPRLSQFLDFWDRELDGGLQSVSVSYVGIVEPAEWPDLDDCASH